MILTIVTGLCGSGKTYYCQDKTALSYDSVFSYAKKKINYEKVDYFFEKNKDCKNIFLDAFNNELIEYIKKKNNIEDIKCKILYTKLDDYYDVIAINQPRNFGPTKYTDYISLMIKTIKCIHNNVLKLYKENIIQEITYIYRNENKYTEYTDNKHLFDILDQSHKDRLLEFIKRTSGHSTYQSILLNNEYIFKGTEKDWITFDNILKCTNIKNKVICDTGCFNGYFSFKSLINGAKKVIGIDHNKRALNICEKIAIYNNYHTWKNGKKSNDFGKYGIHFYLYKIGKDNIFNSITSEHSIDIIYALNYLHHLINELGIEVFKDVVDIFFKNTKEIIFEVNEKEVKDIHQISLNNNFKLIKQIDSHRKTMFGNRKILYYKK